MTNEPRLVSNVTRKESGAVVDVVADADAGVDAGGGAGFSAHEMENADSAPIVSALKRERAARGAAAAGACMRE
jgi:hypothetical protein